MIKLQRHHSQGFSLIEILLLVALVSVSFMGVSSLLRQTVQLEGLAKADFIANALADEGIGLVKAMRSDNVASGVDVFQDIAETPAMPAPLETNYFRIDKTLKNYIAPAPFWTRNNAAMALPSSDPTSSLARLNFDTSDYYSYNDGTPSEFYRVITATPIAYGAPRRFMIDVSSVVTLLYRGKTYTYYRYTRLNDDN